mmetsp:Transcript_13273/g.27864  ORF Transcript_13273/g.27864 Transcript_13273/m.27864 type:complete len:349 (+) Transcript_13273:321-1367(+)
MLTRYLFRALRNSFITRRRGYPFLPPLQLFGCPQKSIERLIDTVTNFISCLPSEKLLSLIILNFQHPLAWSISQQTTVHWRLPCLRAIHRLSSVESPPFVEVICTETSPGIVYPIMSTSSKGQSFPYDHLFKLLMIGDAGVGKSSMLIRFTDDAFDEHIQSTIGVDFKVKHLELSNKRIKLTIWDTAGQERFRTLTSSYYRGAQGVVMVYDVTRRDSFDNLEQWLKEVKLYSPNNGEGVVKLLVGNKIDLADGEVDGEDEQYQRQVDRHEAEEWARNQGMLFLEASAKTKTGVQESFMEVVHKILEDPDLLLNTVPGRPMSAVNLGEGGAGRKGVGNVADDNEGGYCC